MKIWRLVTAFLALLLALSGLPLREGGRGLVERRPFLFLRRRRPDDLRVARCPGREKLDARF